MPSEPGVFAATGQAPRFCNSVDPITTQGFIYQSSGIYSAVAWDRFANTKPYTFDAFDFSGYGGPHAVNPFPGATFTMPVERGKFFAQILSTVSGPPDVIQIASSDFVTGQTTVRNLDLSIYGLTLSDLLGAVVKQPCGVVQGGNQSILVGIPIDSTIPPNVIAPFTINDGIFLSPYGFFTAPLWRNAQDFVCSSGNVNTPLIYPADDTPQGPVNFMLFETNPAAPITPLTRYVLVTANDVGQESAFRYFVSLDNPFYDALLQNAALNLRLCGAGFCLPVVTPNGANGILVLAPDCTSYSVLTFDPLDQVAYDYTQSTYYVFVNDGCVSVDKAGEIWMTVFADTVPPPTTTAPLGTIISSALGYGINAGPAWRAPLRINLPVANGIR